MVLLYNEHYKTIKNEKVVLRVIELYNIGYTLRGIRKKLMAELDMEDNRNSTVFDPSTIKKILKINGLIPDEE